MVTQGLPAGRDLRELKQTARSLLPRDSISLHMIESQEDFLSDADARLVVPMLARMLWEEVNRKPTVSL